MLIINGTVHTMEGLTIPGGYVEIRGNKIAGFGPMEECPKQWEGEVFDAQGGHIQPGFVDAHCHLGMFGDAVGVEGDDGNEATDPCTPHLRAVDAINPMDRCFQEAREAGVTTVLTGPGSANPISGQFAAIKTNGRWVDAMVLQAPAAMKLALGENPKLTYHERRETPTTRMATAAVIRENLAKAEEYREKLERALEDEEEEKPEYDAKLEALLPVLRGELPVHIHAHRADDIVTGIRICKEFHLRYVIVHGTEGHLIPDLLAEEGAGVITGPCLGAGQPVFGDPRHPPAPRRQNGHLHRPSGDPHPVPPPVCRYGRPGWDGPGERAGLHHHPGRGAGRGGPQGGVPGPGEGRGPHRHQQPPPELAEPRPACGDGRQGGRQQPVNSILCRL